jgi:hypothetical protein
VLLAPLASVVAVALLASSCVLQGSWSEPPAPYSHDPGEGEFSVLEVSCASDDFCLTGASSFTYAGTPWYPRYNVWDGESWTPLTGPEPPDALPADFVHLSCATETVCGVEYEFLRLVGDDGNGFAIWDGSGWIDVPADLGLGWDFTTFGCAPDRSCVFADRESGTVTYAVGAFRAFPNEQGQTPPLSFDLQCFAADDCLGFSGTGVWSWDGNRWSQVAPGLPDVHLGQFEVTYWDDIDCTASDNCLAVGRNHVFADRVWGRLLATHPVAARYDGVGWNLTPLPVDGHGLSEVSCADAAACVAVGTGTGAVAWIGDRWLTIADRPAFDVEELSCAGHRCLAVGYDSTGTRLAEWTWSSS